jgi:hypothetical protein
MNAYKRRGNKWTVNELLSLQREYELLEWTVQEIAVKHQRSVEAILYRLESEGFIDSWNDARGFNMEAYKASIENSVATNDCVCNEESCVDDEEEQAGGDDNDSEYFGEEEDDDESVCDDASEVEKLSERVWSLETAVTDIKDMVQQLFNKLVSSNEKKLKPLRKQSIEH